jgi:hypothetical protein
LAAHQELDPSNEALWGQNMESTNPAVAAMAEKCRTLIQESAVAGNDLQKALQPKHLLWMCDKIEQHAEDWPDTKLHRWIGFVQCAMMANRLLDLAGTKAMFDAIKNAYRPSADDQDLVDHLDPSSGFEVDLGGQG